MIIEFDGIINARDLGGLPAADGKIVKPGLLYRTARLQRASDSDLSRLSGELGVKTVVDFRHLREMERSPDRLVPGARYVPLPVLPEPPADPDKSGRARFHKSPREVFRKIYTQFVTEERPAVAYREFFDILLEGNGGTVFHCTQGKDRTGVGAMLILTALGTPYEEIEKDYFLTNDCMQASYEDFKRECDDPAEIKRMEEIFFVWPEYPEIFTACVSERYGTLMDFLRKRIGLTEEEIQRLRELYTQ